MKPLITIFLSLLLLISCSKTNNTQLSDSIIEKQNTEMTTITQTTDSTNESAGITSKDIIKLPEPSLDGSMSVEKAISKRRSVRNYSNESISLENVSQLLWSAQGITDKSTGYRTAPSAGALFPLEVYLIAGNVNNLADGIYRYENKKHELHLIKEGDHRSDIYIKTYSREWLKDCPAFIIISGIYNRTTGKYGDRGIRYVHMEVGNASQNIYLQAESLGLGTVIMGAFDDDVLRNIIGMPSTETPFCIMPVGKK